MMIRSRQSHQEKVGNASFLSSLKNKRETILLLLLIFFLPIQLGKHFWPDFSVVAGIRVDYLSPTFYLTDFFVFLLFVSWVSGLAQKSKSTRWTFICFFAFLCVTIFLSHNFLNGFYHLFKFLEFSFVAYSVVRIVTTQEKVRLASLVLATSALVQSVLAIAQFINQGSIGGLFYFLGERAFTSQTPGIANASINGELLLRPYGTFPHPNVLAGFLLVVMIVCLFSLIRRGPVSPHPASTSSRAASWRITPGAQAGAPVASPLRFYPSLKTIRPSVTRWGLSFIWSATIFIGTSALILSMSRVALVLWFFILATLFFSWIKVRFGKKDNTPLVLVGFLGFCLVSFFLSTPFGTRLLESNFHEEAFVQREAFIVSSVTLFINHPFFGVGLGNFLPALALVQKPLSFGLYLQPVHNIFLLVLAETGLIGFGFFVWFLVKTYRYLMSHLQTHGVFLILLTVVLFLGFFDHYFLTLQQGQLLLAVVLGLCWMSIKKSR